MHKMDDILIEEKLFHDHIRSMRTVPMLIFNVTVILSNQTCPARHIHTLRVFRKTPFDLYFWTGG
jgi:hypothetical protein